MNFPPPFAGLQGRSLARAQPRAGTASRACAGTASRALLTNGLHRLQVGVGHVLPRAGTASRALAFTLALEARQERVADTLPA